MLLSLLLGYDTYSDRVETAYAAVEAEYGVTLAVTKDQYGAMTDAQRQQYDRAAAALAADRDAAYAYNMTVNLMLIMTTAGILLSLLGLEFLVPLRFGNGMTLGKKIFGICLMRTDGVQLTAAQLFIRTVLGKFTIETMIPVCIVLMIFWGILGLSGTLVLLALLIFQLVSLAVTRTNSLLHDLLAGTVAVDYVSQMIFRTTDDLIAYQKKLAAERAARQPY